MNLRLVQWSIPSVTPSDSPSESVGSSVSDDVPVGCTSRMYQSDVSVSDGVSEAEGMTDISD